MLKPALYPALLAACALVTTAGTASARAGSKGPVVVELFTSQGCSACIPANALLAELADRKDVLALTFPVDYWDYLGWRDTFAKQQFSDRQRAYQKALGLRDVYTPQLVVDGAAQTGKTTSAGKAPAMIRAAAKAHRPAPAMHISQGRLTIGPGRWPAGGAEVWLVRYEGQPQETAVKDGENRGVNVVYRNVARELIRLGGWAGKSRTYDLPAPSGEDADLKSAVLLQAKASGRILGALKR
ncbi:MAG: hypothetical protein JWO72_92 [Caulobacteraceae bacterium]|nr:hypothetical protein [Caulobacteraceae bacterium]